MKGYLARILVLFSGWVASAIVAQGQDLNGMATGNYAGVNGVSFNPASIADSRYKFDLNLINVNSTFSNNFLLVKNDAFVRRLFWKQPYASSFDAVKRDILFPDDRNEQSIRGSVRTNVLFPFSFMASTGKRSSIAVTMVNRTINQVDSMPRALAQGFFDELRDPAMYNQNIRTDGMKYNFLNWQEVGFTYSRVIVTTKHHMLKLGATLKWMGANAGAYIQTDNAVVSFRDSNTLSLRSPLIRYARTERADIGQFRRRDILSNLEDQTFGWDAGLVYEFRAKVKKFRYVDEDEQTALRQDLNKYMIRIGVSVVDVGRFDLKRKPLTNDHSANIVNWDFSSVRANNLSMWDTAYAKQVQYVSGSSNTFSYRLPAAVIANFDLHLLGGFYVNVAAKAPLESFNKPADAVLRSNRWVAITPRFEGKFLGVYLPVTRVQQQTILGATVRLGPVWFGSNNLAQILSNPTSNAADFHAGLRLGFPYGKPSRLSAKINEWSSTNQDLKYATTKQLDSLRLELAYMKGKQDSARTQPVRISIYNNGVEAEVRDVNSSDSIVIRNRLSQQYQGEQQVRYRQLDSQTDSLLYALARTNLELEESKKLNQSNNKSRKSKSSREKENVTIETSNKELEKEVERMRKQMAIQNAALIGGGTAAVVASSNSDKKEKSADVLVPAVFPTDTIQVLKDSVQKNIPIQPEKQFVDTIRKAPEMAPAVPKPNGLYTLVTAVSAPTILFASGSAVIGASDQESLRAFAREVSGTAHWIIELTGATDQTGSIETNRRLADQRTRAVKKVLIESGVRDDQIISKTVLSGANQSISPSNQRKVSIRVLSDSK